MAGIYKPCGSERSQLCQPTVAEGYDTIAALVRGEADESDWRPVGMAIHESDESGPLEHSDAPWLGGWALIFRPRAVLVLGSMLRRHGNLLPLACPGEELSMLNPRALDGLDEKASTFLRRQDGGILAVDRHVFRPDVVSGHDLFKIPQLGVSGTYVSHRFVVRWNSAGLAGLDFRKVWEPGEDPPCVLAEALGQGPE